MVAWELVWNLLFETYTQRKRESGHLFFQVLDLYFSSCLSLTHSLVEDCATVMHAENLKIILPIMMMEKKPSVIFGLTG